MIHSLPDGNEGCESTIDKMGDALERIQFLGEQSKGL